MADKVSQEVGVAVIKKSNQDFKRLLASASCALFAENSVAVEAQENWKFDAATLVYVEGDNRVTAIEPVVSATKAYDSETKLSVKVAGDTLTGASPNGATPSNLIQTFTGPSGNGGYTTPANEQPLDDTFKDTRLSAAVNWVAPLNRVWSYDTGGYLSSEHDYLSLGGNGSLSRYFNQKNTTLSFGLALALDTISPVGGAPDGLTQLSAYSGDDDDDESDDKSDDEDDDDEDDDDEGSGGSESKNVVDIVFGVTQVINRKTIMQFNYGISAASGYNTDPYKILSVIDESTGSNYGGNYQLEGNNLYLYEKRPDSRVKQSVYWQTKYQLDNNDILNLSYRFMFDDWGVTSHTVDLKYRFRFKKQYFEPQVRWYSQSKADFYQRYLTSGDYQTEDYASADYRLGDLETITLGLRYGYKFEDHTEFYTRFSVYQQTNTGDKGFGQLTSQELYPDTTATMLTLGYKF